jgi:hypothetical protein
LDDEENNDDDLGSQMYEEMNSFNEYDLAAAFLAAFYNGNITKAALKSFLNLSNIINTTKIPTSFDGLLKCQKKKLDIDTDMRPSKSFYCSTCCLVLACNGKTIRACSECKNRPITLFEMDIEQQIKHILSKFKYSDLHQPRIRLNGTLTDITDGRIYQNMISNDSSDGFLKGKALSFLVNTDGLSLCNNSKLTIWPVYLVINEIPIESRFLIDNVILAGLSAGEHKPNFNLLLQSTVKQLKRLEYGVSVPFSDKEYELKFFLMAGIFDKPARYGVLNMIQFNSSYGCTKCLQEGRTFKHSDTSNT